MTQASPSVIALIGAGPRGASLIERIAANLDPADLPLEIHVIDDAPDGAGNIWRSDQTRELCMNTLSHAVTLFTEPGSTVAGPVVEGPTLYEWSILTLHAAFPTQATTQIIAEIPHSHITAFNSEPQREGLAEDYREELALTLPESHPSRALYGEYLAWCYRRAASTLPKGVRLIRHRTRAVSIETDKPRDRLSLASGEQITVDAVVLATGWMPRGLTAAEEALARQLTTRPELVWVRPGSPVDQDLSGISPGSHAIVRGLGMGFFDTMALLTIERGGTFVEDTSTSSGLRYVPSGREPILHVTSRRGVPFRAKTLYHSLPPAPAQRYLRAVDWSTRAHPINFNRELWPRIVADAYRDHAETLYRVRPAALAGGSDPLKLLIDAIETTLADLVGSDDAQAAGDNLATTVKRVHEAVATFIPDPADRFDLPGELRPAQSVYASPAAFDRWVIERVARDLREAGLGHDSSVKAGLWSISAARAAAGAIGTCGGFDAESRATGFATLMAVGSMAGSGPPAFRNRELLALADAGLVHFIGPRAEVEVDENGFSATSYTVEDSQVSAPALIDAWMHSPNVEATADPLVRSLLDQGRARAFRVASRSSGDFPTASFDIDAATGRLITGDGSLDPAIHAAGIPVDEQLHGTIISPMPGTDPPMLRETDRVARSALQVARERAERPGAGPSTAASATLPTHEGAFNVH